MNKKKDDGVSSVVAVMLVLSVVVIVLTVFLGTYLPGMKATSEMQNSEDIRQTFMNYASAVDSVYSNHQVGQTTWTIQLGAGDVVVSPSKSSGILELKPEEAFVRVSSNPGIIPTININSVDVVFSPTFTYWRNIGYLYSHGVVTITNRTQDNDYFSVSDASKKGYLYDDATKTLYLINFIRGEGVSKSGSGPATLSLTITSDTANTNEYIILENTTVTIESGEDTEEIELLTGSTFKTVVLNATVNIQ